MIALFINNWNENRKDKKYLDHFLSSAKQELLETDKHISKVLPEQKMLIDTLDYYLNNDKISLVTTIEKAQGFDIAHVKLHSWQAISNSKINLLDFEQISSLANFEDYKNLLKTKGEHILNFVYQNLEEKDNTKKKQLKIMIQDVIWTENSLQEDIQKYLNISEKSPQ